eukprot:253994-Hanusia_phi.AAC.1
MNLTWNRSDTTRRRPAAAADTAACPIRSDDRTGPGHGSRVTVKPPLNQRRARSRYYRPIRQ